MLVSAMAAPEVILAINGMFILDTLFVIAAENSYVAVPFQIRTATKRLAVCNTIMQLAGPTAARGRALSEWQAELGEISNIHDVSTR